MHWKADIALRYYQLHVGYTPGPVFLFGLLAGIGGIFTFRRRRDSGPALACLLVTGSAVAVLLGADLYEFSWRYQLPALITLPVAAALGVTAVTRHIRARRRARRRPVRAVRRAGGRCGEAAGRRGERALRRRDGARGSSAERPTAGGGRLRAGGILTLCVSARRPGYPHARLRRGLRGQLDAAAPGRHRTARRLPRHLRVRREARLRAGHPGRGRRLPPGRGVPLPGRAAHLVVPAGRLAARGDGRARGTGPARAGAGDRAARPRAGPARVPAHLARDHRPGRALLPGHRARTGDAGAGVRGAGHVPGLGAAGQVRGDDRRGADHRRLHRRRVHPAAAARAGRGLDGAATSPACPEAEWPCGLVRLIQGGGGDVAYRGGASS